MLRPAPRAEQISQLSVRRGAGHRAVFSTLDAASNRSRVDGPSRVWSFIPRLATLTAGKATLPLIFHASDLSATSAGDYFRVSCFTLYQATYPPPWGSLIILPELVCHAENPGPTWLSGPRPTNPWLWRSNSPLSLGALSCLESW